jgi:predicted small lipoprotein YifL
MRPPSTRTLFSTALFSTLLIASLFAAVSLTGCGKKGSLYLPDEAKKTQSSGPVQPNPANTQ